MGRLRLAARRTAPPGQATGAEARCVFCGAATLASYLERDRPWYDARLPILEERVRVRLGELSRRLAGAEWLDGGFSAGDLMMVTVLRRLHGSGLLEEFPYLSAYISRGEARPAYKRAFTDQLAVFTAAPPP